MTLTLQQVNWSWHKRYSCCEVGLDFKSYSHILRCGSVGLKDRRRDHGGLGEESSELKVVEWYMQRVLGSLYHLQKELCIKPPGEKTEE